MIRSEKVVAAIPAFNEEKSIGSVVLGALRHVDEVVVVDDGSIDSTAIIAERAGAKIVRHDRNRGYGAALRTCLEYARNNEMAALVVLDGDGQHRSDEIPRVLDPVLDGSADICIGSRFLREVRRSSIPTYRRYGIGFLTRLANLGTRSNGPVKDAQSGFRAYSRAAIDALEPRDSDMGASIEVLWEANRLGLRVSEVPIEVDYVENGSTKSPLHHGASVLGSMIRYIETKHALLFFGVPGLVLFLFGLGLGAYVIESYNRTSQLAVGLSLVTVLLLVLGMMLGFSALILHTVINATNRAR